MNWQTAGFGLYVHWPFCQSKCPYCDFNSHVVSSIDHVAWRDAYLTELRSFAALTPNRVLGSIFFGGGTPSLMPATTVAAIIDEACRLWAPANDVEITLEANPTSVEIGRLRDFRIAGVNRVSVGIQALNDRDLRRLGRTHGAVEARNAIVVSQSVFERTSFDLIYARQDQTLAEWERELAEALTLSAGHLSLYQLTIEPGTVFEARLEKGQLRGLPEENLTADMYELTQAMCLAQGRPAYEVSNHAQAGEESRHNLIYWRCGDYVGIGPGAHGRLTLQNGQRFATERPKNPTDWLGQALGGEDEQHGLGLLSPSDQATELMVMGLRITEGISITRFNDLAGYSVYTQKVEDLIALGLLAIDAQNLRATKSGLPVLNSILRAILV
jgi:oxygen-independent coproporphyrinogen-3 oxidase